MTKIIGVYKITNIVNNKVYIGSSINMKKRSNEHFCMLKNGNHHSSKLQKAYNKYGKQSFIFELIEECDKNIITEREQYWLNELDSYNNGYNCTLNVEKFMLGKKHSDETKNKMRKKHKSFSIPLENRRFGEKNSMYGVKRSDRIRKILDKTGTKHSTESKKKMSNSRLCNTNSRKKIILSNLNGEILKKYESLTKASEDLGIKLYVISNILRKKRNNVGNYTFKYDK